MFSRISFENQSTTQLLTMIDALFTQIIPKFFFRAGIGCVTQNICRSCNLYPDKEQLLYYVYRWSWASGRMRALQFLIYVVLYARTELVQSHTILHPRGRRNKWTKVRGSVWTHSVNYLSCCPHALPESNKDLNQLTRQQKNFCYAKWNNDWV